ncbi:MAG: hypothetical protein GX493_07915, partial [Firmicutes bacterium]|nr:hypothetical protein [Bacillota bacterium]
MGEEKRAPRFLGSVGAGILACLAFLVVAGLVGTILLFLGLDWSAYLGPVSLSLVYAGIALGGIMAGVRAAAQG